MSSQPCVDHIVWMTVHLGEGHRRVALVAIMCAGDGHERFPVNAPNGAKYGQGLTHCVWLESNIFEEFLASMMATNSIVCSNPNSQFVGEW